MCPQEVFQFNQVLHGYSDGHRQLQSSLKLPPKTSHILQTYSDLSGSSIVRGFENYLTGYPLPEINSYAFAKTWYAPEMPRPGCVWTHTLIVNNTELAHMADLALMARLFERPSLQAEGNRYGRIIEFSTQPFSKETLVESNRDLRRSDAELLCALYEFSDQSVFVSASSSQEYEAVVLAIWSQQWPRLRRSFKFCTGSLSVRRFDGVPFDLQIIPQSLVTTIERENRSGRLVMPPATDSVRSFGEDDFTDRHSSAWLRVAAADLETRTPLRDFLWRFGSDQPDDRATFKRLAEVYTSVMRVNKGDASLEDLLTIIGLHFPKCNEAVHLKQSLFGSRRFQKELIHLNVSERDLLSFLVKTSSHGPLDSGSLLIRERARSFYERHPVDAAGIAIDVLAKPITCFGEEYLNGVCETITVEDALALTAQNRGVLPLIVRSNPKLFTERAIWERAVDLQREIFDALAHDTDASDQFFTRLIPILLEMGSDNLTDQIEAKLDSDLIVGAILDWLNETSNGVEAIRPKWQQLLDKHSASVLHWVLQKRDNGANVSVLAIAARTLNPHDALVVGADADLWLTLAQGADRLHEPTRIHSMCFLLALGFNNPSPSGVKLVSSSFQLVHDAARRERLAYSDWRLLQYQAPAVSFWRGWDKCERLRHALIERFISFRWPEEYFVRTVIEPNSFRQAIDDCYETKRGRKFLRRIIELAENGSGKVTNEQLRILRNFRD